MLNAPHQHARIINYEKLAFNRINFASINSCLQTAYLYNSQKNYWTPLLTSQLVYNSLVVHGHMI